MNMLVITNHATTDIEIRTNTINYDCCGKAS